MKFLGCFSLLLLFSCFSRTAFAWNCDPRCPDYKDCLEEERLRGNGRRDVQENDNESSLKRKSNLRQLPMQRDLAQTSFLLKMFHRESQDYCWQSEWEDQKWCMECVECWDAEEPCDYSECDKGDSLWIKHCDTDVDQQYFIYEQVSGGGGRLKPWSNQNLCLEKERDSKWMKLQPCENGNTRQILTGFDMYDPFELHPYGDSSKCLTQAHHPKKYEPIKAYTCAEAREDATSKWIVHEPYIEANPLSTTPYPTPAPKTPSPIVISEDEHPPAWRDYPRLTNVNGDCSEDHPCGHCGGDCNTDRDCAGKLECYHRATNEQVPSCSGGEHIDNRKYYHVYWSRRMTILELLLNVSNIHYLLVVFFQPLGRDYCIPPEYNKRPTVHDIGDCTSARPCGHCYGDCQYDTDCAYDLVCFKKDHPDQAVPSCRGGEYVDNTRDYCVPPEYNY